MDSIDDTPAKRRKIMTDTPLTKGFDSDDDSGDNLFEGYETVATLPLQKRDSQLSSFVTQPTQKLVERPSGIPEEEEPPVVQVAGSSPIPTMSKKSSLNVRPPNGGLLASAMAPPGTSFRLPQGVMKRPAPSTDLRQDMAQEISSDEDELSKFRRHSSDEDTQTARRADIRPSSFTSSSSTTVKPPTQGLDRLKETLKNSVYTAPSQPPGMKQAGSTYAGSIYDSRNRNESLTKSKIISAPRSNDIMASSYGQSRSDRPGNAIRHLGPAKSTPAPDIDIDDIADYNVRTKVKRIRDVLPNCSISMCMKAVIQKRGNFDDAMTLLLSTDEEPAKVDLTMSDEERVPEKAPQTLSQLALQRKQTAKQQLKAPNRKIHEKWNATQKFTKPSGDSPVKAPVDAGKPRRRLVQGRKKASPPLASPPRDRPRRRSLTPISIDSEASDSGVGSEPEDATTEFRVLDFINKCETHELADIGTISLEIAALILAQKPFKSLNDVRKIKGPEKTGQGKRGSVRKLVGDKVVDKCLDMWAGYEAIDVLVDRCEELGRPVRAEMEKWSKTSFEASADGEIELASFDNTTSRDSGIGTPSSRDASADEDAEGEKVLSTKKPRFFPQPSIMAPGVALKDYQVIGINWLALLFEKGLSGILADDMGLGKTCQVIAFLACLKEKHNVTGPHLIIVPASTLENWLREFQQFCPELNVMPYYAGQNERAEIREQIAEERDSINVIVTTYTIAKAKIDNKFMREYVKPVCTVYDEGHLLRNSKSAGYGAYMKLASQFRLLLTGTPLQNNLGELASLLGFILPSVFQDHSAELDAIFSHKAKTTDAEESHAALLSAQRIQRAKRMLTPFVLRRKKHQVLKHLPAKHRRVHYCGLSEAQAAIYEGEKARALSVIAAREAGNKTGKETSNVMMALRKASLHPLLFRRHFNDDILATMSTACTKEHEFRESNPNLVFEDMSVMTDMELHRFCDRYPDTMSSFRLKEDQWMDSGKIQALGDLLQQYKAAGDRVLVFSQFVMVLDILEAVLETLEIKFFRLDGSTKIEERQDMLDQFHMEADITVFLLSTGAGGAGINLACANKVVIFDSSFNPQQDIQAENRAHRVGQTREVEVVRLVTRGTIEEQIHALGETKLTLGDRVAAAEGEESAVNLEKQGEKLVADMLAGVQQPVPKSGVAAATTTSAADTTEEKEPENIIE